VSDPTTPPLQPFDLLGPLPTGTTVLEASAGTGKTYTIAGLVARYVAEGAARLDDLLVITFGRMASQELRERVRDQLVEVAGALAAPGRAADDPLVSSLVDVDDEELARRRRRVTDALAGFDSATIATTHQFCQLVLRSLGVAGDTDARATLVEDLDELVTEVVDDLYLREYAQRADPPPFERAEALELARAATGDPQALLVPQDAEAGSKAAERVRFGELVRSELERRKRRLGILSYDDLLSRLAKALEVEGSPAAQRMRARWSIVLVDEFQDTDPVQWEVLERAFHGHATLVLIGDPKQAIYAFRGGDIFTYLQARAAADSVQTLPTNWRSDAPLVEALQVVTRGAALGDEAITVHPIRAGRSGGRLAGAPHPQPLRVRLLERDRFRLNNSGLVGIGDLRTAIADDLAADVAQLLTSGATYDGRPVAAGDVAILMYSLRQAPLFQEALAARGIPSVVNGGDSVLRTPAADAWLALLEALEQPQRSGRIRTLALSCFVGHTAADLDREGDELTDRVGERVRGWLDLFRARGVAAVHESMTADGLAARVLARPQGERLLTDLTHLGQVLHEVSHRDNLGLVALLDWLRLERQARNKERTRRLDTDARAVQLLTIHGSKGLQYPLVHLPVAFDCWPGNDSSYLFHEDDRRVLDISGGAMPRQASIEKAGEELRLTYVALTRAQSQVVLWLGPSSNARHGGVSRLLLGRDQDEAQVPVALSGIGSDAELREQLEKWQQAGGICLETAGPTANAAHLEPAPTGRLGVRSFTRSVDVSWRRTSYSGLIRAEEQLALAEPTSEPEDVGTVDEELPGPDDPEPSRDVALEPDPEPGPAPGSGGPAAPASPMEGLPGGNIFGSLVHAVLEHADPQAVDLQAELQARVREEQHWWPVDATPDAIAEALVPMHLTPLGPLADGLRLVDIGRADRLCELDFEFPLTGGDRAREIQVPLAAAADVLRRHLDSDDPMRRYAERLEAPSLGDQVLRGYLSGSIDVVLRVGSGADERFVVVDYKTNRLGAPGETLTAWHYRPEAMTEAMLHSHYPLQALLYTVVLHRYLRWRLGPSYDPERHLGGVLYLYLRGMCGPETPVVDGDPCGVFSWRPPAAMVVELSDLLAGELDGPSRGGAS
jgi:exodeoxyribonuclease V beta subunit